MKQRSLLLLPLLLLLSQGVQAAPWYRIEVILVAYQDEKLIKQEIWPSTLTLATPEAKSVDFTWWKTPQINQNNALYARFDFPKEPVASWALPLQTLKNNQLMDAAKRISARRDMKVVWHQSWIEPIQESANAIVHPLEIHLADKIDMYISGSISFYRSRFLHINTDLVIQHTEPVKLSPLDTLHSADMNNLSNDVRSEFIIQADIDQSLSEETDVIIPIRAAHVKHSRRMRSSELHYIDHPLLGVIVKVIPVTDTAQ